MSSRSAKIVRTNMQPVPPLIALQGDPYTMRGNLCALRDSLCALRGNPCAWRNDVHKIHKGNPECNC